MKRVNNSVKMLSNNKVLELMQWCGEQALPLIGEDTLDSASYDGQSFKEFAQCVSGTRHAAARCVAQAANLGGLPPSMYHNHAIRMVSNLLEAAAYTVEWVSPPSPPVNSMKKRHKRVLAARWQMKSKIIDFIEAL